MTSSPQSFALQVQTGSEEKKNAKSEEVEILLNDLEVSNQRAEAAEKEVELLKERVEAIKTEAGEESRRASEAKRLEEEEQSVVPGLMRELGAKEREVQHLIADVQKVKAERQLEKEQLEEQVQE